MQGREYQILYPNAVLSHFDVKDILLNPLAVIVVIRE